MINSGNTRDHGVVKGGFGKLFNSIMTPKKLHGLHAGGRC